MKIYVVVYRFGSRTFARAFSLEVDANSYAFRVRSKLGVLPEIINTPLDAPEVDLSFPRPNGAT